MFSNFSGMPSPTYIFQDSSPCSQPFFTRYFFFYSRYFTQNSVQYFSCDMTNAECNESLPLDNQLYNEYLKYLAVFSSGRNMV